MAALPQPLALREMGDPDHVMQIECEPAPESWRAELEQASLQVDCVMTTSLRAASPRVSFSELRDACSEPESPHSDGPGSPIMPMPLFAPSRPLLPRCSCSQPPLPPRPAAAEPSAPRRMGTMAGRRRSALEESPGGGPLDSSHGLGKRPRS
eukprot:tig00000448_g911.t1